MNLRSAHKMKRIEMITREQLQGQFQGVLYDEHGKVNTFK